MEGVTFRQRRGRWIGIDSQVAGKVSREKVTPTEGPDCAEGMGMRKSRLCPGDKELSMDGKCWDQGNQRH